MFQWLRKALGSSSKPRNSGRAAKPRLECLEDRCTPTTWTVANNNDSGAGSLRFLVDNASNGDIVEIPSTIIGIGLMSPITISANIEISGSGNGISRDIGNMAPEFGLFYVWAGKTCTMSNLILSGGVATAPGFNTGGGIRNLGTLTLNCVEIVNCNAEFGGGIYNALNATLDIYGCDIHFCDATVGGGGICNLGSMTVDASEIYANFATGGTGGGIFNGGSASLSETDVYSNWAQLEGGGIRSDGTFSMDGGILNGNETDTEGAGIYISSGASAEFNGVEVTNNRANGSGGGFYVYNGSIYLIDCTVSGNEAIGNTATAGGALRTSFGSIFLSGGTITDGYTYV